MARLRGASTSARSKPKRAAAPARKSAPAKSVVAKGPVKKSAPAKKTAPIKGVSMKTRTPSLRSKGAGAGGNLPKRPRVSGKPVKRGAVLRVPPIPKGAQRPEQGIGSASRGTPGVTAQGVRDAIGQNPIDALFREIAKRIDEAT